MASWCQLGFQDASSPLMEEFVYFHDFTLMVLVYILSGVFVALLEVGLNKTMSVNISEGQLLESIWTLIPAIVLIRIALPSLTLLYLMDESEGAAVSLKAVGHQWYWSYEYTDFWHSEGGLIEFDSYMAPVEAENSFRLLDVDNRVVLPYNTPLRAILSSADVLHSWALPAMGVKADCCPGRLNQVSFLSNRPGVYFGQCSEICGANHSFMPISTEFVFSEDFLSWLSLQE